MNLVIDQGNTVCKIAVFDDEGRLEVAQTVECLTTDTVKAWLKRYVASAVIYSSVGPCDDDALTLLRAERPDLVELCATTPVPLSLDYDRRTLGSDRLAAAVGASLRLGDSKREALIIDAGTAITYEWIDAEGIYRGGNISPGAYLRLRGLHHFTSRLPLISELYPETMDVTFGCNTEEAMMVGVLSGLVHEVEGYIRSLRGRTPEALVLLTGGDAELIVSRVREPLVFAPDLVLEGLNYILEYNKDYVASNNMGCPR